MAESRPLPCCYWTQRKTMILVPSARMLGAYFWTCSETTAAGCYEVHLGTVAVRTGYDESTIGTHLQQLISAQHIAYDPDTWEVFVLDWFRFHKFESAAQKRNLRIAISSIKSKKLLELVVKSSSYAATELNKTEFNKTEPDGTALKPSAAKNIEPSEIAEAFLHLPVSLKKTLARAKEKGARI